MLKDFVLVQGQDALLRDGGALLCARAGDLLLWDSRTIHCNSPATAELDAELQAADLKRPPLELLRIVSYVCMQPRRMATPHQLRCKLSALAAKCVTQLGVDLSTSLSLFTFRLQIPLISLALGAPPFLR